MPGATAAPSSPSGMVCVLLLYCGQHDRAHDRRSGGPGARAPQKSERERTGACALSRRAPFPLFRRSGARSGDDLNLLVVVSSAGPVRRTKDRRRAVQASAPSVFPWPPRALCVVVCSFLLRSGDVVVGPWPPDRRPGPRCRSGLNGTSSYKLHVSLAAVTVADKCLWSASNPARRPGPGPVSPWREMRDLWPPKRNGTAGLLPDLDMIFFSSCLSASSFLEVRAECRFQAFLCPLRPLLPSFWRPVLLKSRRS